MIERFRVTCRRPDQGPNGEHPDEIVGELRRDGQGTVYDMLHVIPFG